MMKVLSHLLSRSSWLPKGYLCSTKKMYILSQFPYPSGELHLGHARVYYIGDTLARYYKLQKNQVIYPIGFDSFGLPAENAAILHGKNPKVWTQNNIAQMKEQLECLNIEFDWSREIATHTPEYYKWTQRIFLQMFRKGLAYKAESEVNWDPVDQTVLANEQVDNLGRSWRSGALVEKKMLSQWFLRITNYAEVLQANLTSLDWIDRVKAMQAGWIGFDRGFFLKLKVKSIDQQLVKQFGVNELLTLAQGQDINAFIKQLSLLQGGVYVRFNIAGEKSENTKEVGIVVGKVYNPISQQEIQIKLGREQNGKKFEVVKLQDQQTIRTNLGITKLCLEQLKAQETSVMRIKDWSISRQRYWGCPIPIIYCHACGIVPVPEQQLPILLPQWKNSGNPLLSTDFKQCICPKCKSEKARRETDTMDTFVDSSWYYLRFLDSLNQKQLCSQELANYWMPVDIYIGGIEHAIMHLLYARFIMRVLVDIGVCEISEPFKELIVQGLVKGKTIKHKMTGKYLKFDEVKNYKQEELEETYQKMSKSKFNGLNPQQLVQTYGPDALRMALFFASPPEHDIDFHEDLLVSADRFLRKVEELNKQMGTKSINTLSLKDQAHAFSGKYANEAFSIRKILEKLENSIEKRYMHVYVANSMELFNCIRDFVKSQPDDKTSSIFLVEDVLLRVLSIIAPSTVTKIQNTNSSTKLWPKSTYFATMKQYLIMKGNKLVSKGHIDCEARQDKQNIEIILEKLKVPKDSSVKFTKRGLVIVCK